MRNSIVRQWELKSAAAAPEAVVWPYRPGDRIEVLFREGRKLLAMNRRPEGSRQ
jgi:hypothetical protein